MVTLAKLKAIVIELKTLEEEAKNLKEKQEKAVLKFNQMLDDLGNTTSVKIDDKPATIKDLRKAKKMA